MSSSKIKPKRSFVSGVSPNQSQLEQGEIAFNYTDKKLFTKNENNEIVEIGLGGGSTSTIVLKSKLIDNRYVNSYSKWSNLPVIGDFVINQGGFINQNNYICIPFGLVDVDRNGARFCSVAEPEFSASNECFLGSCFEAVKS